MGFRGFRAGLALAALALIGARTGAQDAKATWTAELQPPKPRPGAKATLLVSARIMPGWHLYSTTRLGDSGPFPTAFKLKGALRQTGPVQQPAPTRAHDANFNMDVEFYADAAVFTIPVAVPSSGGPAAATVSVSFMTCNDSQCMPPSTTDIPVRFSVDGPPVRKPATPAKPQSPKPGTAKPVAPPVAATGAPKPLAPAPPAPPPSPAATTTPHVGVVPPVAGGAARAAVKPSPMDDVQRAKEQGLGAFLLFAFGAGFLALLTPCVFPMVPITVSFFTKRRDDGRGGVRSALAYCLGIIATFTALGLIVAVVFGATGVQRLATNPTINLALAALFVTFALNLFGVFEIALPSWLVSRAQTEARSRTDLLGPVLMGLTFTLTSFTCTVPVVGLLLVSASRGSILYPLMGMLAFSAAFASPFFLLALFPQYLARLPRSGSWMVSVKALMGFLEVAAALKFVSNADLVWQAGWLTRPVFVAVWAAIAWIAAFNMLGWLRLPHDEEGRTGWGRRAVGAAMAAAGLACLAAANGRSMGAFDAFLPPAPYPGAARDASAAIRWGDDWSAALARASAERKPVFVNFTGVTCTNCRWMEEHILSHPDVVREISGMVPVELYTDRPTDRDRQNQQVQRSRFGDVTLPLYVVLSPSGELLGRFGGSTYRPETFAAFIRDSVARARL